MKRSVIYLIHITYWAFYTALVSFIVVLMLKFQNNFNMGFYLKLTFFSPLSILVFVSGLAGFYLNYCFLFTRYYINRNISKLVFFMAFYSVILTLVCALVMSVLFGAKALFHEEYRSFTGINLAMLCIVLLHGCVGLILKGFITGYSDIKIKEELNRRNFETELALIRSQINPHFLFNTISNIDVLIQKDQLLASGYLNKLSEILRFSLYETDAKSIPLHKELEYIEKYIELQKIRTSNPDYVKYTRTGDHSNAPIVPMLFIPFIENAFKHSEKTRSNGNIRIKFEITQQNIVFECCNTYTEDTDSKDRRTGIGNELNQKRIELLYPDKHFLEISKDHGNYCVKLKIVLK